MDDLFAQFKAFVAAKPADEQYRYLDIGNCALAQFGKSLNPGKMVVAGCDYFAVAVRDGWERFEFLEAGSPEHDAIIGNKTFGDLAAELEALS